MNKYRQLSIVVGMLLLLGLLFNPTVQAQTGAPLVIVLTADGPLTPAMSEYLSRGVELAEQRGAELLVLQLNTPGGSTDLMQEMVSSIRNSQVPVVVYVAPQGAIAGSAGTVITLAGHIAAMAPETAIGAASPVGAQGEDIGETMEAKVKEILRAQVRALAEKRGDDAVALAEATVESAKAVTSKEAFAAGLVDLLAVDMNDLLDQLNGMPLQFSGSERAVNTVDAQITYLSQTLIEQLLTVLTNPNIVFILLSIGVQAVLIELSNPGGWVAGFIGVVCLALAAYGLGVLPVNWFGLVFLGTAFVLFVLDIKAPTHGALTTAGVISLIVGALVLFNSPSTPQFQRVSVPLVVTSSLITGGIFAAALLFAIRSQRIPIRTGREAMLDRVGKVTEEIPVFGSGMVRIGGELWSAESAQGTVIPVGKRIQVTDVQGVRLQVREIS
ncbi:MAG: nodulation protein NfeD [Chloroflexi bacterium]|nr:nodulation protein NfeD [Chloroflexota bacterium]